MHHHHHVALSTRIFLTLSRHPSLSSIAFGRSSGLYPVSAQSCCVYVWARCPAFARPCEGVHRSTPLTSSSLLLQQCPTWLVHLILIVFVTGSRWPYSCCLVGCCLQDCSILLAAFFSTRFVSVHVVHPYSSIDTTAAWEKLRFILSVRSDFHTTDSLSIAVYAFASRVSMTVSVDETLLPR